MMLWDTEKQKHQSCHSISGFSCFIFTYSSELWCIGIIPHFKCQASRNYSKPLLAHCKLMKNSAFFLNLEKQVIFFSPVTMHREHSCHLWLIPEPEFMSYVQHSACTKPVAVSSYNLQQQMHWFYCVLKTKMQAVGKEGQDKGGNAVGTTIYQSPILMYIQFISLLWIGVTYKFMHLLYGLDTHTIFEQTSRNLHQ